MPEKKLQIQKIEQIEKSKTLRALIDDLKIDKKYSAILVNGEKVTNLDTLVEPSDKIVILPKIMGGK